MNKLIKITILSLVILAVVSEGVNIYLSNSRTIEGIGVGELTKELLTIQEKNIELEEKVLSLASYKNIASKAADLGLETSKEFVSLYDPVEVAVNR